MKHPIDNITASDLNVDQVLRQIDSTRTTAGASVFSEWLHTPCLSQAELDGRISLTGHFRKNPDSALRIAKVLSKVGNQRQGDVANFLWVDSGDQYFAPSEKTRLLFWGEMLVLVGSMTLGLGALLVFLAIMVINLVVYLATTKYIGRYTSSIAYLGALLNAAGKIARREKETAGPDFDAIRETAALAKKVPLTLSLFLPTSNLAGDLASAVFEYYRIFLLGEIRAYYAFHRSLARHHAELQTAFEVVGRFDASLCLLALEESDLDPVHPVFTQQRAMTILEMRHPLIADFVALSVTLRQGSVVTGTNMAGKSTFLRTLGLNQLLATTLNLALAKEFHTGFYVVITALEITDDVVAGKSRYLAQAERVLEVIRWSEQGNRLALVDEILSGTNSRDRIQASIAILQHLATTPSLVVASTHDLEIAEATRGTYDSFFFSEMIGDEGLTFDYQIHSGIVNRSNALKILDYLGFSKFLTLPR